MTSTEDRIRDALPGYDIGEQIGKGGCGIVLGATHRMLQRQVAIKQIPAQFAQDAAVRRRFLSEARLMGALDHPHVVPVYDYIELDDLCLLVMEYLPGGTVASRFSSEGFDAASALAVTLACAAGLEAAHRHGVLHRDVKPANLMFTANGTVKLTDFGIAKIVGGNETLVTHAGEIVGTPSYIAPEQVRGQEVSPATDVYALATMVYQLLSGVLPFPPGEDSMAVLFMHAFEQPTPLGDAAPNVPERIAEVVMRGLATDPTDRFESAESFAVALATPAADSWGSDWLTPVGIPVIGADTIVAAATGTGQPFIGASSAPSPAPTPRSATSAFTVTGASTLGPNDTRARVRPAEPMPASAVELASVSPTDVVPIQEVIKFPSPRAPFAIAALLSVITVAVALIGVGTPPRGGDLPPGTVTIAGVDPTRGGDVVVDTSKRIPVTVNGVRGDAVALELDVMGQTVGRHQAPLVPGPAGATALVAAPINPYLLAGQMTGRLTVLSADKAVTYQFGMRSTRSAMTTALAVGVLLLALFGAAYIESYVRALRRGRSRFSGSFGLPLSAAVLAVAVVGAAWMALGTEPTIASLVGCVVLATGAGIAATVGAMRIGRKFRSRRRQRAREHALARRRTQS